MAKVTPADYLVSQILAGRITYEEAIAKFPQYKAEIDAKLHILEDGEE